MSEKDLKDIDPSEYKNIPGNQTAGTPDVNESEQGRNRRHGKDHGGRDISEIDPSEYKNIPGNQTAGTPEVNESEQRR